MGRPLKISKYSLMTGILANGASQASDVPVDVAYPNFGSLTDPAYNVPTQTLTSAQYLGVVGGISEGQVSATNPIVECTVNINLNDGSSTGAGSGRIVRQKGAHKYLVAKASNIADENIVSGNSYLIVSVGTTNWSLFGASVNPAVGDIFTATAAGSNSGTGLVWDVGQCVLSDSASPAAGYMSIAYNLADSAAAYASNLTNKMVRDWTGSPGNYSNSNTGEVDYSDEEFYVANFFTDEGEVTWSGAELINGAYDQNGTIPLALIDNVTS